MTFMTKMLTTEKYLTSLKDYDESISEELADSCCANPSSIKIGETMINSEYHEDEHGRYWGGYHEVNLNDN